MLKIDMWMWLRSSLIVHDMVILYSVVLERNMNFASKQHEIQENVGTMYKALTSINISQNINNRFCGWEQSDAKRWWWGVFKSLRGIFPTACKQCWVMIWYYYFNSGTSSQKKSKTYHIGRGKSNPLNKTLAACVNSNMWTTAVAWCIVFFAQPL